MTDTPTATPAGSDPAADTPAADPLVLPPPSPAEKAWSVESVEGRERWAERAVREQIRLSWLVPFVALPVAMLATEPFTNWGRTPTADDERLAALGRWFLHRVDAHDAPYTAAEAERLIELAWLGQPLLADAFVPESAAELLDMPADLRGQALVRKLADALKATPLDPALAAFAAAVLLDLDAHLGKRFLFPKPDAIYNPAMNAIDARLRDAGVTTLEGGLAVARRWWGWSGWLALHMAERPAIRDLEAALVPPEPGAAKAAPSVEELQRELASLRPRAESADRLTRELSALQSRAAGVERAERELAEARQREAKAVAARDRAQTRIENLEAELEGVRRELALARARVGDVERLAEELAAVKAAADESETEATPPDAAPLPAELLQGREVFLFTGQLRGAVMAAMGRELGRIGAADPRVLNPHKGTWGPERFPAGAVVVMDLRFVGHNQSEILEERARLSGAVYVPVKSGVGGLARAVAETLERRGGLG